MISAKGLVKTYQEGNGQKLRVLDGLSLDVVAGEFVAIVGASGSGKSTLLHVLGGLDTAESGALEVAGEHLLKLKDAALAQFRNRTIGFVFQSFHLVPNLSTLENVMLPAFFADASVGSSVQERAAQLLERVGLGKKQQSLPAQLSGGERQRVAIARSLLMRPKILLCDEPTGNLDTQTGHGIIQLFQELNQEGLTLLIVTHEDDVRSAARRVLHLESGRLVPQEKSA